MKLTSAGVWRGAAAMFLLAAGGCATTGAGGASLSHAAGLERAIAMLQERAHDGDAKVRANAVEALQPLRDPRVDETVEQGLHDPEAIVRFASAMAAGRRKTAALKPELNHLARTDANASVREAAVYGLRRMGDPAGMNALASLLDGSDPAARANAAFVLGQLGEKSAVPLLVDHMRDPDPNVKLNIIEALARLGEPAGTNALIAQSLSSNVIDHTRSLSAAGTLDDPVAVNVLLAGLKDPLLENRLIAARGLGRNGINTGQSIARENLHHPEPRVRTLAVLALGDILPLFGEPAITALFNDPDPNVQTAAAAAVVNLYAHAAAKQQG